MGRPNEHLIDKRATRKQLAEKKRENHNGRLNDESYLIAPDSKRDKCLSAELIEQIQEKGSLRVKRLAK